jgi:hypothetical protein
MGGVPRSSDVEIALGNPIKLGVPEADKYVRRWRIVAGDIGPNAFHCATVPDGPGCKWEGGAFARIEAQNRSALRSHFAKLKAAEEAEIEANGEFTEPGWREVINPDGVRCFVTQFPDATPHQARSKQAADVTDDLSIPPFLGRQLKTGSGLAH